MSNFINYVGTLTVEGNARAMVGNHFHANNMNGLRAVLLDIRNHLMDNIPAVFLLVCDILQFLLALGDLIVTCSAATGMVSDLHWERPPGKLVYNIALAAITAAAYFAAFTYILLGLWRKIGKLPITAKTMRIACLCVNLAQTIAWIVASKMAWYTCGDVCGVAAPKGLAWRFATLCCDCSQPTGNQFIGCINSAARLVKRTAREQRLHLYEVTQHLNITLAVFFALSTLLSLCLLRRSPRPPAEQIEVEQAEAN